MAKSRPRRRTVLFVLPGLLLAGYLALFLGLKVYLTPGVLRTHMDRLVMLASEGRYTVQVEKITVAWDLSVRIQGGRLVPVPGTERPGLNAYQASFGRLTLKGVRLWALIRHRRLHLRSVTLRRPGLIVTFVGNRDLPSILAHIKTRMDGAATGIGTFGLRVDRLHVVQGRIRLERERDGNRQTTRIDNLELVVRDVAVGAGEAPFTATDIRLSVGSFRRTWSDRRRRIEVDALTISSSDSVLAVRRFAMAPPTSDQEFFAGRSSRADRVRVEALGISGSGVDVAGLMAGPVYRAAHLSTDSLMVDVLSDHRLPPGTGRRAPTMPAQRLAALPTPVAVDTVTVRNGTVFYREIPSGSTEEGVVAFHAVEGEVTGIGSARDPVVASASARLFGTVPLSATLWIPLGASPFNLRYQARAGPGEARAVNVALVPLQGVALTQGRFDSVWVEATVVDGAASGTVQARWRDLEVSLVDRETGQANLLDRLGSLAANALVIPTNNPPDEGSDPRIGEIRYDATDRDTFFGYLWRSLRSGFRSLLRT